MNIISKYKSTILLFVLFSLWALHFSLVKLVEADNNPFSILVPLLLILCVLFFLVLKINNQTFKFTLRKSLFFVIAGIFSKKPIASSTSMPKTSDIDFPLYLISNVSLLYLPPLQISQVT